MSECLGPPLSVYSSSLVIYSSHLVIYSCFILDAFMKVLFECFIHMTDYFFSLLKIWPQKFHNSLVYLSQICFSNHFFHAWLITCYTHSLIFSRGFYLIYVAVFFLMLINIYLKLIFHFFGISLSYFEPPFL